MMEFCRDCADTETIGLVVPEGRHLEGWPSFHAMSEQFPSDTAPNSPLTTTPPAAARARSRTQTEPPEGDCEESWT
jgi:hypothetical protein